MSKTTNMGLQLVESYINGPQARLYNHNLWLIDEKLQEGIDSRFQKVDELPETGEKGVIYLVPSELHQEDDICDEYIWSVDDERFELIGSTKIDIDALLGTSYFFKIGYKISTNTNTKELTSFKVYERVYDKTLRYFVDTHLYSMSSFESSDKNREIYLYLLRNIASTNKNNIAQISIDEYGPGTVGGDIYFTPIYFYFAGQSSNPEEEKMYNSLKIVPENIRYFDGYFDIYATGLMECVHFKYPGKIEEIDEKVGDISSVLDEINGEEV